MEQKFSRYRDDSVIVGIHRQRGALLESALVRVVADTNILLSALHIASADNPLSSWLSGCI
jgi:hypothetical protein